MKTDLYTKTILTIIAICLTINVLKDFEFIQPAKASQPLPVVQQTMDVNIRSIGGSSIYSSTIPVEVKNRELDVTVDRWKAGRLDVKVDRWDAGTLDVRNR